MQLKPVAGLGIPINPDTVRELLPLIVTRLLALTEANVSVLHEAGVSIVTFAPFAIVTVSPGPGTTPPAQVAFTLQLPPLAVLVIAAARTELPGVRMLKLSTSIKAAKTLTKFLFNVNA